MDPPPTDETRLTMDLRWSTDVVLLCAGLIFLWALLLGVVKYQQMATSEDHLAHPYIDTAHRAALLYSFASLLVATFVELSAWSDVVDMVAAGALIVFFVGAIAGYQVHGMRARTTNQFADPYPNAALLHTFMFLLIAAEIGGFVVLLAGFAKAQLF